MFAKFVNPWSNTSPPTLRHFSLKYALQGPVKSALSGLLPLQAWWIQKSALGREETSISFTMGVFWSGKCGTNKSTTRTTVDTDYSANLQLQLVSLKLKYFWPTFFMNECSEWSKEFTCGMAETRSSLYHFPGQNKYLLIIISDAIQASFPRLLIFSAIDHRVTPVR